MMMMMMMNHQLSYSSHFQLNVDCVELFCRRIIDDKCRVFITLFSLSECCESTEANSKTTHYSQEKITQMPHHFLIYDWRDSTCCHVDGSTLPVVTRL